MSIPQDSSVAGRSNDREVDGTDKKHDGLEIGRTGNLLLNQIEKRAIDAIMTRRKAEPPSPASVSILKTVWSTELQLEISAQMVHDVRGDIKEHYHGCSVCYMIVGREDKGHTSGTKCRTLPLGNSADGWEEFKEKLKFPPGLVCWNCLLPTVWTPWFPSYDIG